MRGVFSDFRGFVGEIGTSAKQSTGQRLLSKALPFVAGSAGGVLALGAAKQLRPAQENFLEKNVSFHCSSRAQCGFPNTKQITQSLKAGGSSIEEVRNAAEQLCPVEVDLLATEPLNYNSLIARWRQAGYFDPPKKIPSYYDPTRDREDSAGRDVGARVPACVLSGGGPSPKVVRSGSSWKFWAKGPTERPELTPELDDLASPQNSLTAEARTDALNVLQEHGVVLLRGLLSASHLESLRDRLHVKVSKMSMTSGGKAEDNIREYDLSPLENEDPGLETATSTTGRHHLHLRGRAIEAGVRDVQAGLMPLILEYLGRQGRSDRPYLSEVQLMVSEPCAIDQFWHVDNAHPGLTLVVPLTSVSSAIGPSFFLSGSHRLFSGAGISGFCSSYFMAGGVLGPMIMSAGDALLYDSRTIHRSRENKLYNRYGFQLIFRYDFEQAPGVTIGQTWAIQQFGNACSGISWLYKKLP